MKLGKIFKAVVHNVMLGWRLKGKEIFKHTINKSFTIYDMLSFLMSLNGNITLEFMAFHYIFGLCTLEKTYNHLAICPHI